MDFYLFIEKVDLKILLRVVLDFEVTFYYEDPFIIIGGHSDDELQNRVVFDPVELFDFLVLELLEIVKVYLYGLVIDHDAQYLFIQLL